MISSAWAQDAAVMPGLGGQIFGFLPIILIFAVFYFLIIRPQNEEAKKHSAMVKALKKGDVVVTQSGIWGKVLELSDDIAMLEVADGVAVKVVRGAIARVEKTLPEISAKQAVVVRKR